MREPRILLDKLIQLLFDVGGVFPFALDQFVALTAEFHLTQLALVLFLVFGELLQPVANFTQVLELLCQF